MSVEQHVTMRPAVLEDAGAIARIVVETGQGLFERLLTGLMPEQTPESLLTIAFSAEMGFLTFRHVLLAEAEGEIAGLVYAYPAAPEPLAMLEPIIPPDRLDLVRSILDAAEPGSLFVNTFWVAPPLRGAGLADQLLRQTMAWAAEVGCASISLHVWADNLRARRFYARHGFAPARHIPSPDPPVEGHEQGSDILLLRLG